ncbi:hypothetical protein DFH11DRAFT_1544393 [Phellopilus nigrolimitatus]|nr:hypothetical protein DFH11DRAFT_1544393 [Phellopilus nigrolimitatus]
MSITGYALNLHVLDLTSHFVQPCYTPLTISEMPNLHALRIFDSFMRKESLRIELPSLRVADITVTVGKNEESALAAFVKKHGRNLTMFVLRNLARDRLEGPINFDALPDLRELVFCIDEDFPRRLRQGVALKIKHIGLVKACSEFELDQDILSTCWSIADIAPTQLPELKTVFILELGVTGKPRLETTVKMKQVLQLANIGLEWL